MEFFQYFFLLFYYYYSHLGVDDSLFMFGKSISSIVLKGGNGKWNEKWLIVELFGFFVF